MMARIGVTPDQYTVVNLPSDVALFASGEAPVWGGYVNALAVACATRGYKINLIYPDDYGVLLYGDTLLAREDFITANPDLVRRFLRATKGWVYAVEHGSRWAADPRSTIHRRMPPWKRPR